ncbi:hypothetical protein SLEP1_g49650 [Rubroshorea leprosula]|uniref:Uncharacterized protein n=1 Tax=Rubroshorea leprosula TaxID=152421 RepID=A0AAV5M0I5_9ROSI|nr:hypothetical protein SLEP1_g49650 [Rubroshorea leprosula]
MKLQAPPPKLAIVPLEKLGKNLKFLLLLLLNNKHRTQKSFPHLQNSGSALLCYFQLLLYCMGIPPALPPNYSPVFAVEILVSDHSVSLALRSSLRFYASEVSKLW